VALGIAGAAKLSVAIQTLIGAATLSSGMTTLMLVFKTDPLGPGVSGMGWVAAIGIYAGFALLYAWAWGPPPQAPYAASSGCRGMGLSRGQ